MINTPSHYQKTGASISFEFTSMDLVKHYSFIGGNFLKYMLRYPYKNQVIGDLEKALDYMQLMRKSYVFDKNVYNFMVTPVVCSNIEEFKLMIQAYRNKLFWFEQAVGKDGILFNNKSTQDTMCNITKFIESEIQKYKKLQTVPTAP